MEQFDYYPLRKIRTTQKFGKNSYYAKYGMVGHNGIDNRTRFTDRNPKSTEYYQEASTVIDGVLVNEDTLNGHIFVHAQCDGRVAEAIKGKAGYGHMLRLYYPKVGLTVTYGHLEELYITEGDTVKAGEVIALTDNTGDSSAPHLHWGGKPNNPDMNNGYSGSIEMLPYLVSAGLPSMPSLIVGEDTIDITKDLDDIERSVKSIKSKI